MLPCNVKDTPDDLTKWMRFGVEIEALVKAREHHDDASLDKGKTILLSNATWLSHSIHFDSSVVYEPHGIQPYGRYGEPIQVLYSNDGPKYVHRNGDMGWSYYINVHQSKHEFDENTEIVSGVFHLADIDHCARGIRCLVECLPYNAGLYLLHNRTTSCHVHISLMTPEMGNVLAMRVALQELVCRWVEYEPVMFMLVAPWRRENQFCKPLYKIMRDLKGELVDACKDHYAVVNLENILCSRGIGTVEFRLMHGSTSANDIWNWVRLLCGFVKGCVQRALQRSGCDTVPYFDSTHRFMDLVSGGRDPSDLEYVKSRMFHDTLLTRFEQLVSFAGVDASVRTHLRKLLDIHMTLLRDRGYTCHGDYSNHENSSWVPIHAMTETGVTNMCCGECVGAHMASTNPKGCDNDGPWLVDDEKDCQEYSFHPRLG